MTYYAVCKSVTNFREIEEIEENLILPSFKKLKFVNCNKTFWKKLMYKAFSNAKSKCDKWYDYEMNISPYEKDKPIHYEFTSCPLPNLQNNQDLVKSCLPFAMSIINPWN